MFTSCPECGTVFRVTPADLRVAEGFVRCGHCAAIFSALQSLSDEPPAAPEPGEAPIPPTIAGSDPGPEEEAWTEAGIGDEGQPGDAGAQTVPAYTAEDWLAESPPPDEGLEEAAEPLPGPQPPPGPDGAPSPWLAATEPAMPEVESIDSEAADWSQLFDAEDLREVSARIAVEFEGVGEPDMAVAEGATETADGQDEDEDGAPVYVIESGTDADLDRPLADAADATIPGGGVAEPGDDQFGPWAWEAIRAKEDTLPDESAPRRPAERPVEDLWAEEFGDTYIGPAEDGGTDSSPAPRREPDLGTWEEPAPQGPATPVAGMLAAGMEEPGDRPAPAEAVLPRDPGDGAPLPPLWTQRPSTWDYGEAEAEEEDGRHWGWSLGSALLALLLVGQLIHQQRDDLATRPTVGPAIRQVYGALGLALYPAWNLGAFEIRGTEAVAGRSKAGALDIQARINVVGTEPVGLPLVRVTLRDRFGKVLGARALTAAEYLETGSTLAEPLLPGAVIPVRVSLADPGSEAFGYEVDVCIQDRRAGLLCQSERAPFRS